MCPLVKYHCIRWHTLFSKFIFMVRVYCFSARPSFTNAIWVYGRRNHIGRCGDLGERVSDAILTANNCVHIIYTCSMCDRCDSPNLSLRRSVIKGLSRCRGAYLVPRWKGIAVSQSISLLNFGKNCTFGTVVTYSIKGDGIKASCTEENEP